MAEPRVTIADLQAERLLTILMQGRRKGRFPKGGAAELRRVAGLTQREYERAIERIRTFESSSKLISLCGQRGIGGHRIATSVEQVRTYVRQEMAFHSKQMANVIERSLIPALERWDDPTLKRAIRYLSLAVDELKDVAEILA